MQEVIKYSSMEGLTEFTHEPYRIVTKNGYSRWIKDWTFIERDNTGKIICYKGIVEDITEINLAEEELRYERDVNRQYFEIAGVILISLDTSGNVNLINPRGCEILGYPKEELIGKNWFDDGFLVPEEIQQIKQVFHQIITGGLKPVRHYVNQIVCRDGSRKTIEWHNSILYDSSGKIIGLFSSGNDITERMQAEVALRNKSTELEQIFGAIPDAIIFADRDRRIIKVNQSFTELFGYQPEEVYGRKTKIIYTKDQEFEEQGQQRYNVEVRGKHDEIYEIEYKKKNGEIFFSETIGTPVTDYEDHVIGFIGIVRDITEKKKAEKALYLSENKYRSYVDNAPDGIFIIDNNGYYIDVNSAACRMSGYSRNELLKMKIADLNGTDLSMEELQPFRKLLATGKIRDEIIVKLKNGRTAWWSLDAVKLDENRFLGYCQDITDKIILEKERLKQEKLESVGVLAGGIAHDFNNMLVAIMGNISFARMQLNDDSEVSGLLEEAEKAADRAKDLTHQLLTFSKGGAPVFKILDLKNVVKHSVNLMLHSTKVRGHFDIEKDLFPLEADEGQISQVFNNLTLNAIQAMPNGGELVIKARNIVLHDPSNVPLNPGLYILIEVKDQGIGILQENLKKIFDPYFTTKKGGSGLGLASCYSIIQKHNGHLTVESERGMGTSFFIYLPVSDKEIEPRRKKLRPVKKGSGNILVLDDEVQVLKLARSILEKLGFTVSTAVDGDKALEQIKENLNCGKKFDAIICDLTIPGGKGGSEIIRDLKRIDPSLKAVLSSGYSNDSSIANYKNMGFAGVLAKPYRVNDIAEILNKVLTED